MLHEIGYLTMNVLWSARVPMQGRTEDIGQVDKTPGKAPYEALSDEETRHTRQGWPIRLQNAVTPKAKTPPSHKNARDERVRLVLLRRFPIQEDSSRSKLIYELSSACLVVAFHSSPWATATGPPHPSQQTSWPKAHQFLRP